MRLPEYVTNCHTFISQDPQPVLLLEKYKPYRGGNEMLRAIHDLDIQDKHKKLIVTPQTFDINILAAYDVTNPKLHNLSVTALDVYYIFPEDTVFSGKKIIETLKDLMELVNGVIEAFAALPR